MLRYDVRTTFLRHQSTVITLHRRSFTLYNLFRHLCWPIAFIRQFDPTIICSSWACFFVDFSCGMLDFDFEWQGSNSSAQSTKGNRETRLCKFQNLHAFYMTDSSTEIYCESSDRPFHTLNSVIIYITGWGVKSYICGLYWLTHWESLKAYAVTAGRYRKHTKQTDSSIKGYFFPWMRQSAVSLNVSRLEMTLDYNLDNN